MRTNAKATNWPTRNAAAHNMPRELRKGEKVASPRTKAARNKRNVIAQMDKLLERAQRFATRCVATHAADKRALELDRSTRAIGDAAEQRRVETHYTRAPLPTPTAFVSDGLRYFAPLDTTRSK